MIAEVFNALIIYICLLFRNHNRHTVFVVLQAKSHETNRLRI